ncbi:hypothetical protein GOQ29_11395 [Clostridium sp. D2Q-14]|uniref:putative cytokinetic ring protein SteA n=1 Tax=Anaeromonas gelatinilytica TaxID=2683194 RepID=UPI00193B18DB|nr:hypothetical protein [Anaeromonas gelatinilytica]
MTKIKGLIVKNDKTKFIKNKIGQKSIALIKHTNLDEIAAYSLIECGILAVINTSKSCTGSYPNRGPRILHEYNIPLYDIDDKFFSIINTNDKCKIVHNQLYINDVYLCEMTQVNDNINLDLFIETIRNFMKNTWNYMDKEIDILLSNISIPYLNTEIINKDVLLVSRGHDYKKDLYSLSNYIKENNPIIIGIDGGGDALIKENIIPNIIVGDMDSVSDDCLFKAKEIVVHGYLNGEVPGKYRIEKLGLKYKIFNFIGTSEDAAIILAYLNNCRKIILIGSHNNIIDFLEKGRKGMASTIFIRSIIGDRIIDVKGINNIIGD